jgi:hypothetical protein
MCCGLLVARQADGELGELADLAGDLDRAAMLLRDDVVTDRQTEARPLAGRLGGKERLEILSLISGGIPVPLSRTLTDRLAEIACRCGQAGRTGSPSPGAHGQQVKALPNKLRNTWSSLRCQLIRSIAGRVPLKRDEAGSWARAPW